MEEPQNNKIKGVSLFVTYAGISIILFFILLILYGFNQLRREKIEMSRLIQHQGQALIQSMAISWQNAVASDNLIRQLVAERLLDNAYLIDRLMTLSLNNPLFLKQLVRETHIFRVIITDAIGRPILDSYTPLSFPNISIPKIPYDPAEILRTVRTIIYNQKQQLLNGLDLQNPFTEDLIWVAMARRESPGAIIIIVQADYINRFRSEIGLQKIINEIGSKPGIEYLVYEDPYIRIAAPKGGAVPAPLPGLLFDYINLKTYDSSEITKSKDGKDVLEIRHPFSFRGKNIGLIRIGLPLINLKESEKSMRAQAVWFGLLVIVLGILGIFIIFYYQYRQYRFHKMHEEEMRRKDKLISIGKLAAGVAHEIRNPLNAISMAMQRLQHEFIPPIAQDKDDFLHFTGVIRDEIKRVDTIITEFLNFTKEFPPEKIKTSLTRIIDDLLIVFQGEAEKNHISLEKIYNFKVETDVWCTPDRIKQCLINIIRNAIQVMPDGGQISIALQFAQEEALISIGDTGPGLSPAQIEKIFEFYYTDREGGIGLGLPISQKIMEEHGGRIEVESQVGKGSAFILHLPLNKPSVTS